MLGKQRRLRNNNKSQVQPLKSDKFQVLIRWGAAFVALLAFILVPFFLFATSTETYTFELLGSDRNAWVLAITGIALLTFDVFLPIPSSIVSTMAGAIFGVSVGTGVSFLGMTGSCVVGWYFGRQVGKPGAGVLLGEHEFARLQKLIDRYGLFAIAICRPVPVAAEASMIIAGTSASNFRASMGIAALSNLGISLVYATVGAYAWSNRSFMFAFLAAILLPAIAFVIYRYRSALTLSH